MEFEISTNTGQSEQQTDVPATHEGINADPKSPAGSNLGKKRVDRLPCIRTLKRRSSVENFGQFGLLTPALVLLPYANRCDSLTQQFHDLQGEHKELKLAAAHIEDALTGRGNYGKARSYFKSKRAQRCFNILSNPWFQKIIILNVLVHSLLISWEPPSYNIGSFHSSVVVVNLLCLLVYAFDLVIHITFLNWTVFWSKQGDEKYWNGVRFVLVCCFTVDFVILISSWLAGQYFPQVFRCLRLSMLLCKSKNIRHIFDVLKTIGIRLIKVFFVYLVFIYFFACIGIHLFMNAYECNGSLGNKNSTTMHHGEKTKCFITQKEIIYKGTFNNVLDAMIRLFVLLSTENYPEVMLPSLRAHYVYFAFFGIFIFVGVFFLTAILLAIIVDSYWEFAKKSVKEERARERAELAKAWNLLDPLGHGTMSIDDEKFTELFRILKPKNSDEENQVLIGMLDANNDNEIDSFEWTTTLSQVLNNEFEEDDVDDDDDGDAISSMKWLRLIRELCCRITQSVFFSYVILVFINVHCILFGLHWKDSSSSAVITIQGLKTVIVTIFMFEVIARCIALRNQILQPIEVVDTVLVLIGFLFNILWYINYPDVFWFRQYAAIISGVALFGRLLFNSTQLLKAVRIIVIIAPVMLDLILLLTILIYLLSTVGMELLHNKKTNTEEYPGCGLGFQTFWCSCLTMFQILSTSNWHEIMNKVVESTRSKWYILFFFVSYIMMTLIVMNVFVAIAIEAFNKLVNRDSQELKRHSSVVKNENKTSMVLHMIGSVAGKIFRSTRAENVGVRRQSLAPGIIKTTRSGSIANPFNTVQLSRISEFKPPEKVKTPIEEDEVVEDWSNLSITQKREMMLKKRMKKKKKARLSSSEKLESLKPDQIVQVITAFCAFRKGELNLSVGDEVMVTEQLDDWWQGECKGKSGWFPASHVTANMSKAIPEYHNKSGTSLEYNQGRNNSDNTTDNTSSQKLSSSSFLSGKDNAVFLDENESSNLGSPKRSRTFSRGCEPNNRSNVSRPHSPAMKQPKMKFKKSRDWRKEILGDMTIMNADEMRELNNIMRAELRTPSAKSRVESFRTDVKKTSIGSTTSEDSSSRLDGSGDKTLGTRDSTLRDQYVPKEETGSMARLLPVAEANHKHEQQPMLQVSFIGSTTLPPTPPARTNSRDGSSYLKVKAAKEQKHPKPATKSGEMPEWMMQFVSKNNLVVGQDMKLAETDISSEPSKPDLPHVVPENNEHDAPKHSAKKNSEKLTNSKVLNSTPKRTTAVKKELRGTTSKK